MQSWSDPIEENMPINIDNFRTRFHMSILRLFFIRLMTIHDMADTSRYCQDRTKYFF